MRISCIYCYYEYTFDISNSKLGKKIVFKMPRKVAQRTTSKISLDYLESTGNMMQLEAKKCLKCFKVLLPEPETS